MPPISVLDIIDIVLVAIILYQLYRLIKGTAALSIFLGIFLVYLFWLVVKALNMELISSILGQVIGVGVLALIIVFQQEIRKFLLIIGNRYLGGGRLSVEKLFNVKSNISSHKYEVVDQIVSSVEDMAATKTGALIVIGRKSTLDHYTESGEILNARISAGLIMSIFSKNSPLHDGALLIEAGRIYAARCPLPTVENIKLAPRFGMRHRAALGLSEITDSLVIVVSEETGKISLADNAKIKENIKPKYLRELLLGEIF